MEPMVHTPWRHRDGSLPGLGSPQPAALPMRAKGASKNDRLFNRGNGFAVTLAMAL